MGRKNSKLLVALDRLKGRDYQLEHQKKLQKQAKKRKQANRDAHELISGNVEDSAQEGGPESQSEDAVQDGGAGGGPIEQQGSDLSHHADRSAKDDGSWATDEDQHESDDVGAVEAHLSWRMEQKYILTDNLVTSLQIDINRLDDSVSSSDDGFSADGDPASGPVDGKDTQNNQTIPTSDSHLNGHDEDIPLSDIDSLPSEERGDLLPHQRLTINNTAALLKSYKSITLPLSKLPFSEHQSITAAEPTSIPDINDDLSRELAFYAQCLAAAKEARTLLTKEGIAFTRPADYFAEMVKSDEHMGRIKQKLVDEAASRRAAADARRQRDLRKFGKQVQVAKVQERAKAKRDTLDKINLLKRKRKGLDPTNEAEEDLFDVAIENEAAPLRRERTSTRGSASMTHKPNIKRQKKDQKYGFGGKKRHSKSGDAISSADMRSHPGRRMKDGFKAGKTGASKRLGKSRRAKRAA